MAGEAEIEKAIDQFYGFELSVDGILREIETGEIDYESLDADSAEYSQPVVRLVNALLSDAVKRGASDIHFEPEEGFLRFRYRIDGVLRQIRSLHKTYWPAMAVRLKVMSKMNIAETRAPQDGRISLTLNGRPIDFRVSTQPTIHGENIVLRVLDREKSIISLDRMNLPKSSLAKLNLMQQKVRDLQAENQEVKSQKSMVVSRLAALDTTQRKLAETSGINRSSDLSKELIGQGGPDGNASMTDIERMTAALESELRQIKAVFDKNP